MKRFSSRREFISWMRENQIKEQEEKRLEIFTERKHFLRCLQQFAGFNLIFDVNLLFAINIY